MKAEYINPFIESTLSVFKTMIGIEPKKTISISNRGMNLLLIYLV